MGARYKEYGFDSARESHMHRHFLPKVLKFAEPLMPGTRVLDVGGNQRPAGSRFTPEELATLSER